MTSIVARISMFVAALIATVAIGAPSALADPPYGTTTGHTQSSATTHQPRNLPHIDHSVLRFRRVAAYRSAGFDWSAAGVGALAAVGACVVLIGVGLDVRRRREPTVA